MTDVFIAVARSLGVVLLVLCTMVLGAVCGWWLGEVVW